MAGSQIRAIALNFNPRPPCGGRHGVAIADVYANVFQSTPPVRGATDNWRGGLTWVGEFQSTPPVRGATVKIRIFIRIFK